MVSFITRGFLVYLVLSTPLSAQSTDDILLSQEIINDVAEYTENHLGIAIVIRAGMDLPASANEYGAVMTKFLKQNDVPSKIFIEELPREGTTITFHSGGGIIGPVAYQDAAKAMPQVISTHRLYVEEVSEEKNGD